MSDIAFQGQLSTASAGSAGGLAAGVATTRVSTQPGEGML